MIDHPDSDSPVEPPDDSDTSEEQSNTPAPRDTDGDPEATFVGPFSVDIPGKGTEETFVEDIQDAIREEENDGESDKTMVIDGVLEDFADSLAMMPSSLPCLLASTLPVASALRAFFVSFPLLCSVCSPFDTPIGFDIEEK